MKNKLIKVIEKVQSAYWRIVPYNYRPMQVLYQFKCWAWRRHTTIKSRYMPHTWMDRVQVLPDTMFEILSQFIEEECSPGHIEWYGDYGHKIIVNGKEKYVRDEMQDLYDWWHNVYQKTYRDVEDILFNEAEKHNPIRSSIPIDYKGNEVDEDEAELFEWNPEYKNDEDKNVYHRCMVATIKLEKMQNQKLDEMLHRLIDIRQYLWT